jgi:hypothetical protein
MTITKKKSLGSLTQRDVHCALRDLREECLEMETGSDCRGMRTREVNRDDLF